MNKKYSQGKNQNYPSQNYNNYNQDDLTNQQNYSNQNYEKYESQQGLNQQYQNYNNYNEQQNYNGNFENQQYTGQPYQNYNNQQYYNQENQNYANANQQVYNQQYQNYNNPNQQYQNYENLNQQGLNQKYQNYNNSSEQEFNQQYQNYRDANQQGTNPHIQNYENTNQQGFNHQYQNYNNINQQGFNQQQPNFNNTNQNPNMNSNTQGAEISNFEPNKKKQSKLIPIISTVLGLVLISGGGLYYYSNYTNKSISSIFSFSKNKSDKEAYAQVLEKYKEAMDKGYSDNDSEVNKYAIKNYNDNGKDKNFLQFNYYDIDGNGTNELFITEENKPNSPVAVYSYDSNNIRVLYQAQSDSDIPRAVFYKNQTIWIHTQEKDTDRYVVYKLNDKKDKYDKIHDVNLSDKEKKDGKFKDTVSNTQYGSKEEFLKNRPQSNEKLEIPRSVRKTVYTYNEVKQENSEDRRDDNNKKPEFTNSQLALIGRAYVNQSTDPKVETLKPDTFFSMQEQNGAYITDFGTLGSSILVRKVDDGIEIKIIDYDKPVGQRDFKLFKKVTYKEIQEKFKKEDMDRINKTIEEYKNTDKYKKGIYKIND
ncbi:hypothetical protein ACWOCB_02875 [Gemella haemolysans]|uniref:Uncharacterized protein n=1 Tax=Gemella haemolysans ATCC 10379 TaxID=546270 RepID=C5NYA1_9BACL|nr:hypothetical protein [Gemella haemolysans]EER68164.1 hypothetical protein GEMHA0001_0439 [Gemella haemolysans ATCC 10379]KAA8709254.1 hypothetical protein F4V11_00455 [Gemella haemolysans]UBH82952.1 hypothetical protein LA340_03085 [Gemella haemolysans]VEI38779.1 Uncharacterised protein [Gemella haemolysans]